jgi:hypothetical protein
LALQLVASALAAGCANPTEVECGPGTELQNGVCVAPQRPDSGPFDAQPESLDARYDATDAETDAESPAPLDAPSEGDSSGVRGDPCPETPDSSNLFVSDCDKQCTQSPQLMQDCANLTCSSVVGAGTGFYPPSYTDVFRTPNAPGTDPKCTTICPFPYAYGFGFTVSAATSIIVRVGDPYVIIAHSARPFCADSQSIVKMSCARIDIPPTHYEEVYVMTNDPNAPARNITVTLVTGNETCP